MFKKLNTYNLPKWLERFWENLQNETYFGLMEECEQYRLLYEDSVKMEEEGDYISKIIDRDAICKPFPLTEEEVQMLAIFLANLSDRNEIEAMKMYTLGCRDMLFFLRGIKVID